MKRSRHPYFLLPAVTLIGIILLGSCASSYKEDEIEMAKTAPMAIPGDAAAMPAAEDMGSMAEPASPVQTAPEKQKPVYLSADDSNSAASPIIARQLIRSGKYVQPAVVRTYEFLNYYSFEYPAPESEIAIIPQMRHKKDNVYSLQIALRSANHTLHDAPPFQFTLLLDVSGSMAGDSAKLAETFLRELNRRLRKQDRISLITFSREADLIFADLKPGPEISSELDRLFKDMQASDVTNLESGLLLAYTAAEKYYDGDKLNRVIVLSDGGANAGETSAEIISSYAEDSDRQGIYLAGIGMGEGFNDSMMNALTDKGRGAYLFLDGQEEVARILSTDALLSNFDLSVKDVRLKMEMPPGWEMEQFHGEQISTIAAEVIPQYLAPGDQMIYHMDLRSVKAGDQSIDTDVFTFEAEYTPLGGRGSKKLKTAAVSDMTGDASQIEKGDAVVAYAEMLKTILYPLEEFREANLSALDDAYAEVEAAQFTLQDPELEEILSLLKNYRLTLQFGEQLGSTPDKNSNTPAAALGISPNQLISTDVSGPQSDAAVQVLPRLRASTRLLPQEGYKFLLISSGPVGNSLPSGGGQLSDFPYPDPQPRFIGRTQKRSGSGQQVFDLQQVRFTVKAPAQAKSFSFDFNFFSAEYPDYIQQNFNDTFYAILEANSTNRGSQTNISFDANNNTMEVDNNYFQNPFHPIPNTGTGFDYHGSTGWLRTSWPIRGGETFTITFSIHDEGDGIYDSLVVLDNFRFHDYDAVGTTDPLN